jgi:hypothetical protein
MTLMPSAAPHLYRGKRASHRAPQQSRGLADRVVWRAVADLKPYPENPRRHPEAQIASLMKSIRRVWTNPILVDESGTILAGHGRHPQRYPAGHDRVPDQTQTINIAGVYVRPDQQCLELSIRTMGNLSTMAKSAGMSAARQV